MGAAQRRPARPVRLVRADPAHLAPAPADDRRFEAETAYFSREAIERAAEPKELFVIDGATHIDLYDRDEYVTPAVARLTEFFGKHLAG